jgi:hypothetical protein
MIKKFGFVNSSDSFFDKVEDVLLENCYRILSKDNYSFEIPNKIFRQINRGRVYYLRHYNDLRGSVDVSLNYSIYQNNFLGNLFMRHGLLEKFFNEMGFLKRKISSSSIDIRGFNSFHQEGIIRDFSELFEDVSF